MKSVCMPCSYTVSNGFSFQDYWNLHTGFTGLPAMMEVPDHSVSELQSELLRTSSFGDGIYGTMSIIAFFPHPSFNCIHDF